jgi:alkylation response protein AidB-like acyl-CoA dehydrogenase
MKHALKDRHLDLGPITARSPELPSLLAAIGEGASQRDQERAHPLEALALVRQLRLGALRLPASDGGGGATARELFAVIIALADADPNVAHILRNHYSFVERFLRGHRLAKLEKWRKAVAAGAIFGLAYGELEATQVGGSEIHTVLAPDGDGYRLNGTKYYSTGSLYADYVLVRARLPDGAFASPVVPANRAGVELVDDWDGFGQRVTGSGTTIFRNVRLEADEVVLESDGPFFKQPYPGAVPQLILTAVSAGIARTVLRDATALIRSRKRSFTHAPAALLADDPILQQAIGQIASDAFATETVVLAAADALDRADDARSGSGFDAALHEAALLASQAKVVVDEMAVRAAGRLLDVGGASATRAGQNLDRHWRNARTLATHNPTSYKARSIGDHIVNGTPLPNSGFF